MHEPSTDRARPSSQRPHHGPRSVRHQRVGRALAGALLALALTACGTSLTSPLEPGDAQPASAFVVSPQIPTTDVAVTFDARAVACAASPCTFVWDDVTDDVLHLGEGEVLMVTFPGEGPKRVRLTVTDADGHALTHLADLDVLATGFTPVPRPSVPEFVTLPGDEPIGRPPHGRGLELRPVEPPGLARRGDLEDAGSPTAPR